MLGARRQADFASIGGLIDNFDIDSAASQGAWRFGSCGGEGRGRGPCSFMVTTIAVITASFLDKMTSKSPDGALPCNTPFFFAKTFQAVTTIKFGA